MPATEVLLATREHEPLLRKFLRDHPVDGSIRVSYEREPDYFRSLDTQGSENATFIAIREGKPVGAGYGVVRMRYVNGDLCRCGYLGGLRLDSREPGNAFVARRGYRLLHEWLRSRAEVSFTSIITDNKAARRFLEASIPGLPRYEPLGGFSTLLIRTRRGANPKNQNIDWLASYDQAASKYQLSPAICAAELGTLGIHDAPVISGGGASALLWDQRSFRQSVVREYPAWIGLLASIARGIPPFRIPAVDRPMALGVVSFASAGKEEIVPLIRCAQGRGHERGLDWIALGFSDTDPRIPLLISAFNCRRYRSTLYRVSWPEDPPGMALDDRIVAPEVALL
jgi:hypothetical protein